MQDRLDRLERDLSMLQRQVYRGGPAPVVTAGPAAAVDAEVRMDRLEAADARTDRAGRGRGERGRAAAAAPRANQQRHRRAIQPRPRASRASRRRSRIRRRPRGIAGSPARRRDTLAMRGPPPAASAAPVEADRATRCRREPWCRRHRIARPERGTLTPPGAPEPRPPVQTPATLPPPGISGRRLRGELPAGSASEQYNRASVC